MSRLPKFQKEMYDGFEFPSADMEGEIRAHSAKLVKCRNEQSCSYCGATIQKGDYAIYEKGFLDGKPVGVHDCLDCVEDVINGWDDDAQERWKKRAKESGML